MLLFTFSNNQLPLYVNDHVLLFVLVSTLVDFYCKVQEDAGPIAKEHNCQTTMGKVWLSYHLLLKSIVTLATVTEECSYPGNHC